MKTETKSKMPKTWRMVEIVTHTDKLGYTGEELKIMLDSWDALNKWAYIVHDKDVEKSGLPATPHYHILLKFRYPYPSEQLIKRFPALAPNYFQKVGAWKSAVLYLTHKTEQSKKDGKFPYDNAEVVSNFDYTQAVEEYSQAVKRNDGITDLINKIGNGDVKRYNLVNNISVDGYVKYKRQIENAFEYRGLLMTKTNVERDVIYIQGASGVGKTTFAKLTATSLGYHYFVSSSSNDPFDGYKGEECVILDDARAFLSLSDMLKLLDNNTNSSVKSRYYNKDLSEVKLIILTSTISIDDFFKNVFSDYQESKKQLFRRCKTLIKMDRQEMRFYAYNEMFNDYRLRRTEKNRITTLYGISDNAKDDVFIENIFNAVDKEIDKEEEKKKQKDYEKAQKEIEKSVKDDDLPF